MVGIGIVVAEIDMSKLESEVERLLSSFDLVETMKITQDQVRKSGKAFF